MKKVLILICVVIALMLASCGYSKEDLERVEYEAYRAGFQEGYDLAKYEDRCEIEKIKTEEVDSAYDYGYERGYEIGYEDGYSDATDGNSSYDPENRPRIEKDK